MHLSDCTALGGMTAMDLSEKCEVEEEVVLSQMTYWSSRGVVRTRRNDVGETFYEIIEVQAERAKRDLEETLPGASSDVTEQVSYYLFHLFSYFSLILSFRLSHFFFTPATLHFFYFSLLFSSPLYFFSFSQHLPVLSYLAHVLIFMMTIVKITVIKDTSGSYRID